ncbi:MAG: ABC transporter substrate-binding protein [Alphaproteobacteria bacterium]|jgi:branched-chain amino acid transport system substrate-binding protein|nr:ABC transporter substrate-binding protein [Alphaproteobacteria bacterium]|tara:strand:+ start:510 stop:1682 length:1173 start_codon:yes stop_codon:yes gene_type:complete
MIKKILSAVAILVMASSVAYSKSINIGFVTTLTTGAAIIGVDQKKAVDLAVEHIGGKMGALDVNIIYEDDEFNPQKGKQKTEKLIKSGDVDIVAGYIWSHVLLASAPVVLNANKILISANAGPSPLAGKNCHKNFFNISWQNDQTPMALGEVLNQRAIKSLYVIAPNYAAGKDMVAGVERTFKGKVVGKDMTTWPTQIDWSAEFTKVKAAKPGAVFTFYPGKHGAAFLKQYAQAGLSSTPLYSVYTLDSLSLPRLQQAKMTGVLGTTMTQFWSPDMDNSQNKRFVADFKKKHGSYPSFYAAQAYDSIFLIKSAVEATGGKIGDIDAMRSALEKADFPSVRGKVRFGKNHFPIQNFYSREVVVDSNGKWTTKITGVALKDHQDVYAKDCNL